MDPYFVYFVPSSQNFGLLGCEPPHKCIATFLHYSKCVNKAKYLILLAFKSSSDGRGGPYELNELRGQVIDIYRLSPYEISTKYYERRVAELCKKNA